jgi:hypothetical protein
MLYIFSAHLQSGRLREYHQWLTKNRDTIQESSPDGWNLRGLYFAPFGLSEHLHEIHWELDSYDSFTSSAAACREGPFAELLEDWFDFFDLSNTRGRVLKEAFDAETVLVAR